MSDGTFVEIRGLTKRYGAFTAVDHLDLDARRGEMFGLLGPNGAGKTTTMRLLMGILRPTTGTARIDGLDCSGDRVEVKRHVGFLADEPLFPDYLRGIEIVRFVGAMHGLSRHEIEARAWPVLERVDMASATNEYAVNYSQGMKKKLGLVCGDTVGNVVGGAARIFGGVLAISTAPCGPGYRARSGYWGLLLIGQGAAQSWGATPGASASSASSASAGSDVGVAPATTRRRTIRSASPTAERTDVQIPEQETCGDDLRVSVFRWHSRAREGGRRQKWRPPTESTA